VIEAEVQIVNRLGLHARAAARFVHIANKFQARITVTKNGTRVDGKSILGLLTLAASKGVKLRLSAEGEDEKAAIDELVKLVRQRFGEDS
jgi:phosphocarrier protein